MVEVCTEDATEAVDRTHVRSGHHQMLGILGQKLDSFIQSVLEEKVQVVPATFWHLSGKIGQPGQDKRGPAQVSRVLR